MSARRVAEAAPILTADAMRSAEARTFAGGTRQIDLMEAAGNAVARQVARLAAGRPILVLAGPGNNGGDGFCAARHLAAMGRDVVVAALGNAGEGASRTMREAWTGAILPLGDAPERPVVVDALFGIGLSRPLPQQAAAVLARPAFRIAVDVPSGVASDGGQMPGEGQADVTIALGALKPAHVLQPAAVAAGHVILADIGIAIDSAWRTIARPRIGDPGAGAHKFTRGLVAVVGGTMPGAARLTARAAMRGGAGYVVLTGQDRRRGPDALVHRSLADTLTDDRVAIIVIGPGLGRGDEARMLLERVLAAKYPLVIDGDALSLLGRGASERLRARGAKTVLTPHAGEFDRTFDVAGCKITRTLAAAKESGCVILHKGADTVIAHPDGRIVVSADASAWLASAGTGDVLAGLVAARMATGAADATAEAVWLHSEAARRAGPGLIADDLIDHLPAAIAACV